MLALASYVIKAARRDKLFVSVLAALIAVAFFSVFLGGTSISEKQAASKAFASYGARLVTVLGLSLFVIFHIRRLFESREILLFLSKPISKAAFVWGHFLGFCAVAVFPTAMACLAVAASSWPQVNATDILFWGVSLWLELCVVIAFSLFVSLGLSSVVVCTFVSVGFYMLARGVGILLAIANTTLGRNAHGADAIITDGIRYLSFVLPRIDLMTQSRWIVYGASFDKMTLLLALQAIIYATMLVSAASFDLKGKEL